jgi:carbonic anhydrase
VNDDTPDLDGLLANNRRWADATEQREPGFFTRLAQQQNPRYMWIGCADSRVPANEITGSTRARCSCTATWPTWWCTAT